MSVVSYIFIAFLICTLFVYYIVPGKIQWIVLLVASLIFYGYAGLEYLGLVIVEAFIVYAFSMKMQLISLYLRSIQRQPKKANLI